jgi:hypothetical protein
MINYNTLGNKLKVNILGFTENISEYLNKPKRKFVFDMFYGIIAARSCKISEITRTLKENIEPKKTAERLARNLDNFTDAERVALEEGYIVEAKKYEGSDSMLLIDGGDATKKCSPKMEAIGIVRDGSTGKFAPGYWTMGAVILSDEKQQPIPVYEKLYPCKKQGGSGITAETKTCLESLRNNFRADMVRVFDCGFDSSDTINNLVENNEKFILRVNYSRVCVHNGKRTKIDDVVRRVVCENELAFESKDGKKLTCKIGMTQVVLPKLNNLKLTLVVCKGFGEEPLVLYTNIAETLENIAVRIVKGYLLRWRIEDFYAFKKEDGLKFEDFRVRSLNSIKNLDFLVTIAAGYIAMLSEKVNQNMTVELIAASKRMVKTSTFLKKTKIFFYAVLDGAAAVLAGLRCGISSYFKPKPKDNQLCFEDL